MRAAVRGRQEAAEEEGPEIGFLTEYGWKSLILGPPRVRVNPARSPLPCNAPFLGILNPSCARRYRHDQQPVAVSLVRLLASANANGCVATRNRGCVIVSSVELNLEPAVRGGAWKATVAYVGSQGGFRRSSRDITPAGLAYLLLTHIPFFATLLPDRPVPRIAGEEGQVGGF